MYSTIMPILFLLYAIFGVYIVLFLLLVSLRVLCSNKFFNKIREKKPLEDLCVKATEFYVKELGINNCPEIYLKLEFPKSLPFIHGYINRIEDTEKSFRITLHMNYSTKSVLKTLAHEMVHLKQCNSGNLKIFRNNDGEIVRYIWGQNLYTNIPYEDRPWEIEAFAKEGPLSDKFIKKYKVKNNIYETIWDFIMPF